MDSAVSSDRDWNVIYEVNSEMDDKLASIAPEGTGADWLQSRSLRPPQRPRRLMPVVKVVMCSRGGSASEVETHKNIDSVLHTKTTFQAHSIFSVSIQK